MRFPRSWVLGGWGIDALLGRQTRPHKDLDVLTLLSDLPTLTKIPAEHAAAAIDVAFDDPNLISDAGLVPVVALAEQAGRPELVAEHLAIEDAVNSAGANPAAKVMSLLAGMSAGADSIDDVDRLRHAGTGLLFDQIRALTTPARHRGAQIRRPGPPPALPQPTRLP